MSFKHCARCGYGNGVGDAACGHCGAALGPAVPLAYAPPPPSQTLSAAPFAAGQPPAGPLPLDFAVNPFESIGDVLEPTFRLYREHLGTVARIVLVAAPVEAVFQYLMARPGGEFPGVAVPWLASTGTAAVVAGALVHAVMTLLRTGKSPAAGESFAWGLRKWWKLILVSWLTYLLVGLGWMLLCLPGVIAGVVFSVALPVAAAEDAGPFEALGRSLHLTAGYRALIFVTMLVMALPVFGAIFLIMTTSPPSPGESGHFLTTLVSAGVTQLIYSLNTTLALFLYLSLRVSRGEVDAPPPAQPIV